MSESSSNSIYSHQAARLQKLVEFIQSQGSCSTSESSSSRRVTIEGMIDEIQLRLEGHG